MKVGDTTEQESIACDECDLLIRLPAIQPGEKAVCPRCSHLLTENIINAPQKISAYAISAFIFLIFSLPFNFLTFQSKGNEKAISLLDSVYNLFELEFDFIGILLLFTTIIIPAFFLLGLLYVMLALELKQLLPATKPILVAIFHLLSWNMAEIFLIGILVSFIKIAAMAQVSFGPSFAAYVLFIVCLVSTASTLDRFQIWRWVKAIES